MPVCRAQWCLGLQKPFCLSPGSRGLLSVSGFQGPFFGLCVPGALACRGLQSRALCLTPDPLYKTPNTNLCQSGHSHNLVQMLKEFRSGFRLQASWKFFFFDKKREWLWKESFVLWVNIAMHYQDLQRQECTGVCSITQTLADQK